MENKPIDLVLIRNHLSNGIFNEDDRRVIEKLKNIIIELDSPFNEIAINAINNCEHDIHDGNLKQATQEVRLIQNFAFINPEAWNSDFFYEIELQSYIEQSEDVERIKKLFDALCRLQCKLGIKDETNNSVVNIFDDFFLSENLWPENFKYPKSYRKFFDNELLNLEPWYFLYGNVNFRFEGLKERYPNRVVVPFSRKRGSDDMACFEVVDTSGNPRVSVIRDWASPGCEKHEEFNDFLEWLEKVKKDKENSENTR